MSDTRIEAALERLKKSTSHTVRLDLLLAMQEVLNALPSDAKAQFHAYNGETEKLDYILGFVTHKHLTACFAPLSGGVRVSVWYGEHCARKFLPVSQAIEMLLAPHTEDYGNVVVTPVDGGVRIEYLGRKTKLMAGDCFEIDNKKIKIVYRGEQR